MQNDCDCRRVRTWHRGAIRHIPKSITRQHQNLITLTLVFLTENNQNIRQEKQKDEMSEDARTAWWRYEGKPWDTDASDKGRDALDT